MHARTHSDAVRVVDASPSERREEERADAFRFETPTLDAVSLSCEISAYAPDGDDVPLF